MSSKKILIITLSSIFVLIALFITILFMTLGVVNRYYYSNVIKATSLQRKSQAGLQKRSGVKIEPFGKITFLLGDLKVKKRANRNWKKLSFGQHLSRGDSVRVGVDSKVEITLKSGEIVTFKGFKKLRIDSSILSISQKTSSEGILTGGSKEGGKIRRLTGEEETEKETSPVSAIRSVKPKEENDKKTGLKTRIGN